MPFDEAVAEPGSGSPRSAITTRWPAVRPLVISVHVAPIAPTPTFTVFGSPSPSTTRTVWPLPFVETAEVGTASREAADFVTIVTVAREPLRSPLVSPSRPMMTGYVVVDEAEVPESPIETTLPVIGLPLPSGWIVAALTDGDVGEVVDADARRHFEAAFADHDDVLGRGRAADGVADRDVHCRDRAADGRGDGRLRERLL